MRYIDIFIPDIKFEFVKIHNMNRRFAYILSLSGNGSYYIKIKGKMYLEFRKGS